MACELLVPWPGIEPTSPALQSGFLTTGPQGKSWQRYLDSLYFTLKSISWVRLLELKYLNQGVQTFLRCLLEPSNYYLGGIYQFMSSRAVWECSDFITSYPEVTFVIFKSVLILPMKGNYASLDSWLVLGLGRGKFKRSLVHLCQHVRKCSKSDGGMLSGLRRQLEGALTEQTGNNLSIKKDGVSNKLY